MGLMTVLMSIGTVVRMRPMAVLEASSALSFSGRMLGTTPSMMT
jgi:hypothetical protein